MKRREFLGALPLAATGPYLAGTLGGGLGLLLAGCGGEALKGPVAIKWDRDTCERCRMVISEKRFAAQVRDQNRKVHKFDDIGCAVFWLAHQPFNEQSAGTEYWVADYAGASANPGAADVSWLDARQALFADGKKSPMGYNFGAYAEATAEAISYTEMKKRVLSRGK
ncbi:MAG: protein NosL [Candidatus Accumulibacter sp. 66-26]|nr:nitrous oxide reductase accessory protein NosL [Accumulibacter sp.]OJW48683.1 MAG: protein NosL [Candidatus Accumulibacter sp. 66-26]